MAEIQASPVLAPESIPNVDNSEDEKKALLIRLDDLLEEYLNTLDEYQKAREQLSKQLSSGYLSLAQANFHNQSTSTRYGQDCYDERMQVIRKITITAPATDQIAFSTSSTQPSPNGPEKETNSPTPEESEKPSPEESKKPSPNPASDPLRWFGILVPQALRSAQASFISAVDRSIPDLATLARELRGLEMEVGRVQKQIKRL
ncbi:hypothetical protein P153DRAFT_182386 [Dothidotthia symphoricarpi CBS 119687]|uniref:Vacuolar ATPase assembly protein VMA22 n=1 Tax=Dothidotthia symphoricarpi CBS 119687 TaxID=1392245 RepID=A0A6A6AM13_9PLEO|nr:uncharacterized protein P153DRAFT_182386 [Dothidotthia symphoricarpi CBS 119687]KAF2131974.1 hypothetical protein P153DRAFT_182386 [Dothidotthia symphoricarpi CBS 119687]